MILIARSKQIKISLKTIESKVKEDRVHKVFRIFGIWMRHPRFPWDFSELYVTHFNAKFHSNLTPSVVKMLTWACTKSKEWRWYFYVGLIGVICFHSCCRVCVIWIKYRRPSWKSESLPLTRLLKNWSNAGYLRWNCSSFWSTRLAWPARGSSPNLP